MQKALLKTKTLDIRKRMANSIKKNFRFATLDFIFVMIFVNIFAYIFGSENSIVGVIFVVLMGCSMARDLTNAPIKHFLTMTVTMIGMTVAACYVNFLNPYIALPINFIMAFFILYSYTYEYSANLYFPYILSYLFMIFITPVTPTGLGNRLVGIIFGCASVMIYHIVMNRKHAWKHIKTQLNKLLNTAELITDCIIDGTYIPDFSNDVRENVCQISRLAYERRKRILHISDASFAIIDTARGIENLITDLIQLNRSCSIEHGVLLEIKNTLIEFKDYVNRKTTGLAPLTSDKFNNNSIEIFSGLEYIRAHMIAMYVKNKRKMYHKTFLSVTARIRGVLKFSNVRFIYALRVSVLIALFTMAVQLLKLSHGKWILFTIASVSLPCADDVGQKAIKRMAATVIGGLISFIIYTLIPNSIGRTVIMMLSGYVGFYFAGYTGNYACATVGALGGAVYLTHFGWDQVGTMYGIRLMYIAIGIVIAVIANQLLFPIKRKYITSQLSDKYIKTVNLLEKISCNENVDTQLYYSLIIQSHMIEETLIDTIKTSCNPYLEKIVKDCRNKVRNAHRYHCSPATKFYKEYGK